MQPGFPRTPIQVEVVKLLRDKTNELYLKHRSDKGIQV